jgi:hypothetical protein
VDARKPGGATAPATRADKTAALNRLIARCPERLLIIVRTFDGDELAEYDLPAADGPQPRSEAGPESPQPGESARTPRNHRLRGLILEILDAASERLTGPEVFERLRKSAGYQGWVWTTVERALIALRKEGLIDNETDEGGSGYGLL